MKKFACFILMLVFINCYIYAEKVSFHAIQHASLIIETKYLIIYVDPVGELESYKSYPKPDIILVTHTHRDHFSVDLIKKFGEEYILYGPKSVVKELGFGEIINNGETIKIEKIKIEAIPMYNITPERKKYHKKGDGNGYIVSVKKRRIYISGDTEDIPEMRALKKIDDAFICMNLPYTMTVEQAASAVLEFKPKRVYPYHYRGKNGFSDLAKFRNLLGKSYRKRVIFMDWYSEHKHVDTKENYN